MSNGEKSVLLGFDEIAQNRCTWTLDGSWNKRAIATIDHLLAFLENDGYRIDHEYVEDEERFGSDPCCKCGATIYDHPLAKSREV